jgi:SAM-dependent methyltransferase
MLVMVLPIKASPIADAFVSHDKKHLPQPSIPLDLYQCQDCGHVQNVDIVNPDLLFRDYLFQTGSSAGLIEHFSKYAKDVVGKFDVKPGTLVLEIGSNDGTLLAFFKDLGLKVLGVDPAVEIAKQASAAGITTLPEFFTSALVKQIADQQGLAKLIVANNVYAHSDHLADMTDAIASLLDDDGIFVFEVSYLLDIIDNFLFDTIYHEHLSYHAISSLQRFFKSHGLHFFDVEKISTKGGSMRGFVQKINGPHPEQSIIEKMIQEEMLRGLHQPAIFQQYEKEILARKDALTLFVNNACQNGKRIVAYGASTTVVTLMYHFELESKLAYLVDDNPKKQGLFSPGCHLEVKPSRVLYTDKPDIVIVLAWQYADVIIRKNQQFITEGGVFVVPLPTLKVIASASENIIQAECNV